MTGWIAILLIAGATGLVAYLATRRSGAHVTTITHRVDHDASEK